MVSNQKQELEAIKAVADEKDFIALSQEFIKLIPQWLEGDDTVQEAYDKIAPYLDEMMKTEVDEFYLTNVCPIIIDYYKKKTKEELIAKVAKNGDGNIQFYYAKGTKQRCLKAIQKFIYLTTTTEEKEELLDRKWREAQARKEKVAQEAKEQAQKELEDKKKKEQNQININAKHYAEKQPLEAVEAKLEEVKAQSEALENEVYALEEKLEASTDKQEQKALKAEITQKQDDIAEREIAVKTLDKAIDLIQKQKPKDEDEDDETNAEVNEARDDAIDTLMGLKVAEKTKLVSQIFNRLSDKQQRLVIGTMLDDYSVKQCDDLIEEAKALL